MSSCLSIFTPTERSVEIALPSPMEDANNTFAMPLLAIARATDVSMGQASSRGVLAAQPCTARWEITASLWFQTVGPIPSLSRDLASSSPLALAA